MPGRPSAGTLLTVLGIGLGASLIFASLAVGQGVERSIERTVEASLGRADFRVSAIDGGTLSDEMLVTIESVHGVEVAAPSVELPGTLLAEPESAAASGSAVTIHGIDPVLDAQIHDPYLVAGDTITRPDEAAAIITERLAAEDGYGLGSDVIVSTPGAPERFRVIGIAAGDGPLLGSDGRTVTLPIDAVTRLFGIDGVARVDLLIAEGVPVTGVRAELGEALAGQSYALASRAEITEALRLPTTGLAATVTGLAAAGILVGAVLVFGAIRVTREAGEVPLGSNLRGAAAGAAIGSAVGWAFAFVAGVLTRSDLVPGLGGVAAAILIALLVAVAAVALPLERITRPSAPKLVAVGTGLARIAESAMPRSLREDTRIARTVLERDGGGSARTVLVMTAAVGVVVAVAAVGRNLHQAVVGQRPGPVLGHVVAQIDDLGLLAAFVAGFAIVGIAAFGDRERLKQAEVLAAGRQSGHVGRVVVVEAGILGLAGAALGCAVGLAVGIALILLGGGWLDPAGDLPWTTLALWLVLGVGLSMAAAWFSARLAGRPSMVRAGRFW